MPMPKGIDMVVCLDSTAGMQPFVVGVRDYAQELVKGLKTDSARNPFWRIRLIAYRDLNEGEPFVEHQFTTDIKQFAAQVSGVHPQGGGDEPENTLDAIYRALDSEWRRECCRFVIAITDAGCHSEMHPSTVQPGHPSDVDEVIKKLHDTRAHLYLLAPRFHIYDALACADRTVYDVVSDNAVLGDIDFAKLMSAIGKTVSRAAESF
jgi:hypothetical protein